MLTGATSFVFAQFGKCHTQQNVGFATPHRLVLIPLFQPSWSCKLPLQPWKKWMLRKYHESNELSEPGDVVKGDNVFMPQQVGNPKVSSQQTTQKHKLQPFSWSLSTFWKKRATVLLSCLSFDRIAISRRIRLPATSSERCERCPKVPRYKTTTVRSQAVSGAQAIHQIFKHVPQALKVIYFQLLRPQTFDSRENHLQ